MSTSNEKMWETIFLAKKKEETPVIEDEGDKPPSRQRRYRIEYQRKYRRMKDDKHSRA